VVEVPDQGPDDRDEHGAPLAAHNHNGGGDRVCCHCGQSERPGEPVHEVWVADEGRPFLLHRRCEAEWLRDA
jgi:hypothetical protein